MTDKEDQNEPLRFVRQTLAKKGEGLNGEAKLVWTKEDEKRLENVPGFVMPMAKMGVERYAMEKGYTEITPKVMDKARERMGM